MVEQAEPALLRMAGVEAVVRACEPLLFKSALRSCRVESDARDLVQDTFERALRSPRSLAEMENPRGFLLTVLYRLDVDRARRRARAPQCEELNDDALAADPPPSSVPIWRQFTPEQVRLALAELGEEFRRISELRVIERLSYNEISRRLKISRATVGTRLMRARHKLRDLLMATAAHTEPADEMSRGTAPAGRASSANRRRRPPRSSERTEYNAR